MDNQLTGKIEYLRKLLALATTPTVYLPADNLLSLTIPKDQYTAVCADLTATGIVFDSYSDDDILIKLSLLSPAIQTYYQEINFRQRIKETLPLTKDVAILDFRGNWLLYDRQAGITTSGPGAIPGLFLIENALAYYDAFGAFTDAQFADYVNTLNKEIVLYSSAKGIKRIAYPDYLPNFDPSTAIIAGVSTLLSRLSSPDFSIYFKNELFGFTPTSPASELQEILIALPALIRSADNNLQLYLKNFSFEKLKSDLIKEKEKYFASLRDILGKNLSQIVAIPISFAASVFATYKVNDVFILLIILAAFLAYSWFTYYLQSLYLEDVGEIEQDFGRDFRELADKSGLPAGTIDAEKVKIERRIQDIRMVIRRYRILLIALSIVFTLFIVYQLIGVTVSSYHVIALFFFKRALILFH
ncbi:MAG TPA: hypothetical protein VNS58_09060 [Puia sp.]|nr:hypothetical protein [Puia sp.]